MKNKILKIISVVKTALKISPSLLSAIYFVAIYFVVVLSKRAGLTARAYRLSVDMGKRTRLFVYEPTDFAVLKEIFYDREYDCAPSGKVGAILDIGSNVGYSVIFLSSLFPGAVIHAYEPDPATFERLKKNVGGDGNVFLHNVAVSDKAGSVDFFVYPGSSMSSSLVKRIPTAKAITVPAITLGDAMSDAVGGVDLIKYDIEGAEYSVFAANKLWNSASFLIGEFHEDLSGRTAEEFSSLFGGYKIELKKTGEERYILIAERK